MSRKWKWIVRILIGLVVAAVLATAGFMVFNHWSGFAWAEQARSAQAWEQKGLQPWEGKDDQPWGQIPRRGMPMQPYFRMSPHRFGGFFPLGMIFGSVFYLGLLTLMALGVMIMVRHLKNPIQPTGMTGAAAPPTSASVLEAEVKQAPVHNCPNCSRPVQEGWSYCPNCGAPQKA